MSFRIRVPDGYNLLSSVHSWIYPDIQPVPEQTGDGFFGRAYVFDNENVAMIIKQSKAGASLRVSHSETNIPRNQLRMLVRRTLGQGISFDEALSQMKHDPVIARLVPGVSGVRPYMSPTPFEALIKTIIQQQISYRAGLYPMRVNLGSTFQTQLQSPRRVLMVSKNMGSVTSPSIYMVLHPLLLKVD
ncbi:MAG: hypothetical protein ACXAAO_09385 [Candidatus Thorarchaeota archaeon]